MKRYRCQKLKECFTNEHSFYIHQFSSFQFSVSLGFEIWDFPRQLDLIFGSWFLAPQPPGFQQSLVTCLCAGFPQSHLEAGAWLPSTNYVQDNFILINADAFLLAPVPYLQSIWYKLPRPFCCTKPALSNKVLAHVSTGAPKLPLCLQESLKLLIAFCANGPYALDKVSGKSGAGL